jgi:hypothetical protein
MKHPYHTLLPVHMQKSLMDVAAIGRVDLIDSVARDLQTAAPHRFQDENSVALRRFYHEPRQLVPKAGYIVAYPLHYPRT